MTRRWQLLLICVCFNICSAANAAPTNARLAIIIDDIGYNQSQSERAARLKGAFTLSILPFTPYGLATAELAHRNGKELMLHLPMSAINNRSLGKGGLVSGMEKTAFLKTIQQDIASVPHIQGVNNHMGSRLTQEAEPMQWLMEELYPRKLYFVDSRTSAQTQAFDIANRNRVPSLKRDVFLDDINEQDAIEFQLTRAIQFAKQRGMAVAIGHPYPATLSVLENMAGLLQRQNVSLVYASQLIVKTVPIETPIIINNVYFIHKAILNEPAACIVPPEKTLFNFYTNVEKYDNIGIIGDYNFGY